MSEPDVSDLLTVSQAVRIIDAEPVNPRLVQLPLHEAQGLRLAEDLHTDRDYPPFDRSLMDGYAVRSADVAAVPADLEVIGEIAAGSTATRPIAPGQAMAIMTGAPLPAGADGVVPVEDVDATIDSRPGRRIRVLRSTDPQRHVARSGTDARAGMTILRVGMPLEAAQLAAAAMVGAASVRVYAAPRVAILSTGNEIVPFDQKPAGAQIRNANSIMLLALLRRIGCRVVDLGLAGDSPEQIRRAILRGVQLDALVVTGGMSMGRYDYVPMVLRELGVDLKVTKVRIKPGKPFIFGTIDRTKVPADLSVHGTAEGTCHVFGLPGNPVSGFVCLHCLARRLLARLAGGTPEEQRLTAQLQTALPPNGPREFYQPALLEHTAEGLRVRPLQWKGSADLFTLAAANSLLIRRENEPALVQGSLVQVMPL